MATDRRRLFSLWRLPPFRGMVSAAVGERLLRSWQASLPFRPLPLADLLQVKGVIPAGVF